MASNARNKTAARYIEVANKIATGTNEHVRSLKVATWVLSGAPMTNATAGQ